MPVVLIEAPLIATVPPEFVVILVSAVVLPTVLLNVVVPELLSVSVKAPLTDPPKVSPAVPLEMVVFAVSTVGVPLSPMEIALSVVCTVPAIFTCEGAVAVMPPVNVIESVDSLPKVTDPVLEKVTILVIVFDAPLNTTL